ncbi:FUSC family protein [Pseudomonas bohemica]|uniref:FUSC family protein n=1 Tax=Pseudomonas bohemica TaxID=2044872 RepID=UPI000DA6299B|nr:FUSC family protein [Pseudomonas bohemica]
MQAPDKDAWLFAIKTCIAALITLYIALDLSLDRPSWAVTTVFIASQLYAGATVSKSVYRLLGTCLGAIASVVMVPNLVQTPELLCLALAAWVAGCLFVSLLDRSPRSYIFMLAGYSAAFICFPAINTPLSIFDLSVARVEEISLGVICSSLVHTLVMPRFVQNLIDQKIDSWLDDAQYWWISFAASPNANTPKPTQALTAKLAAYPSLLEAMGTHLAYENAGGSKAERTVHHLVMCQSLLLPLIASIEQRLGIAERQGLTPPIRVKELIHALPQCITSAEPTLQVQSARQIIAQMDGTAKGWDALFWQSLTLKIEELLDVLVSVHKLRSVLRARFKLTEPVVLRQSRRPQLDLGLAALSALTAFCSVLAGCALWIATGWEDGASVPMIAAVACSFFAALDTPIPSMKLFLRYVLVSVVVTLVYTSVLLPLAGSFEMVALLLAPALIALGLLMANPATAFIGMVLSTNIATLIALNNQYSGDFVATLNGSLATVCGLVLTMAMMSLLRARTPTWRGHRIMMSALEDLQNCLSLNVGDGQFSQARMAFVQRMVDRLHMIIPRMGTDEILKGYLLAELRLGANVLDLRHSEFERTQSDAALTGLVKELIDGIGTYVASKQTRLDQRPSEPLQGLLDQAIVACQRDSGASQRRLQSLVNIRLVLFPDTYPSH